MTEVHLGDATYAKWDGESITLRKDSGFDGADQEICLTPALMNELVLYIEDTFNLRITVGSKSDGDFSAFIDDMKEKEKKAVADDA